MSIATFDAILVPFTGRLRAILTWQTPRPAFRMRAVRRHCCALYRKHIAVACGNQPISVAMIEHLDFDRLGEWLSANGQGTAPDEKTRITAFDQMLPFQL